MDVRARITAKGQVTIPVAVREKLGLTTGDDVIFRVEGQLATLAKSVDLLDLAGAVPVPASKRGTPWDEIRSRTRSAPAAAHR